MIGVLAPAVKYILAALALTGLKLNVAEEPIVVPVYAVCQFIPSFEYSIRKPEVLFPNSLSITLSNVVLAAKFTLSHCPLNPVPLADCQFDEALPSHALLALWLLSQFDEAIYALKRAILELL